MQRHSREMIRHHAERVKDHVRKTYWNACADDLAWQTPRIVGIVAKTKQSCSSWCCGNRRPWEGRSLQERRHYTPPVEEVEEQLWADAWGDPYLTSGNWWWFDAYPIYDWA